MYSSDKSTKVSSRKLKVYPTTLIEPGIAFHKVDLPGGDDTRQLGIYQPVHVKSKMGCIFTTIAGSTGFTGRSLDNGKGNPPEILPYVKAGYTVVAYSMDGNVDLEKATNKTINEGINSFSSAHYGVDNVKAAIDYALANVPNIDKNRIFIAGHSSAGTVALLASENEPRIKACIAYAPAVDLHRRYDKDVFGEIDKAYPDFDQILTEASPITNINLINCPVFVFHADDDSKVSTAEINSLISKMTVKPTYVHVKEGEHYGSMINEGIPQGIHWLSQFK